jgi:hypothetical protein
MAIAASHHASGAALAPPYAQFDKGFTGLDDFSYRFPNCGPHVLTVDGTPNYILDYTMRTSIPALKAAYGAERLKRATFAMILCDPAQRAQSFTYHLGMHDFRVISSSSSYEYEAAFNGGRYSYALQTDLLTPSQFSRPLSSHAF